MKVQMGTLRDAIALSSWVLAAEIVGWVSSIFTVSSFQQWYAFLDKPSFSPPEASFGPIWVVLYFLMGLAAYYMWGRRERPAARRALAVFVVQLFLNALWSPVFFGLQYPLMGVVVISMLLVVIAVNTYYFWRVRRIAGVLMLPYLGWVAFATVLNISIWWMNS
ncbi:MAG TPA: TspO/MBR family protein [Candidatus Paceibacterota bacterium]|nr:TspO/MBR family protein [Candidatus Paceibacterota bacterium]